LAKKKSLDDNPLEMIHLPLDELVTATFIYFEPVYFDTQTKGEELVFDDSQFLFVFHKCCGH
jgi:hypothetical protein